MPLDSEGIDDWRAIMHSISELAYDKPLQMDICPQPHRYGEYDDYLAKARQTMEMLYGMMEKSRSGNGLILVAIQNTQLCDNQGT